MVVSLGTNIYLYIWSEDYYYIKICGGGDVTTLDIEQLLAECGTTFDDSSGLCAVNKVSIGHFWSSVTANATVAVLNAAGRNRTDATVNNHPKITICYQTKHGYVCSLPQEPIAIRSETTKHGQIMLFGDPMLDRPEKSVLT